MARKITMFELHFDGAHFGPSVAEPGEETMGAEDAAAEARRTAETAEEGGSDESTSRGRLPIVLAVVGVLSAASLARVAIRRFRADSGDDLEIEVGTGGDEDLIEEKR
ncbi:MAG: hypothetical protein V5A46_06975 [Haloferacaceae archaeon]